MQGERGASTDLAVEQVWGSGACRVVCWDFAGVVRAVRSGAAQFGVVPVENTIIGAVPGAAEAIADASIEVEGHVELPIAHCLLGPPGTSLTTLRAVYSHPAALAQCRQFLDRHGWVGVESYDTAGAAREVAARRRRCEAAIAGAHCAERYGLEVLVPDVGDRPDNRTRFALLARAAATAH
jgi:prephenate dehydratase